MEDKEEVIIDGVNVSRCENIESHSLNPITLMNEFLSNPMCRAYQSKCEGHNCYFKQLSRKTAECEELKEQLNQADNASGFILHDYQRLEKVLNKIKSYCEYIQAFNEANKCNKTDTKTILDIINEAKDYKYEY